MEQKCVSTTWLTKLWPTSWKKLKKNWQSSTKKWTLGRLSPLKVLALLAPFREKQKPLRNPKISQTVEKFWNFLEHVYVTFSVLRLFIFRKRLFCHEKTRKRSELENNILKEKEGYKWWSDEFLEWFKENLTDKGYAKDKDPIEYLKSTGEDGLIQDAGMVVSD